MNSRVQVRTVDTAAAATSTIVNKDRSEVHWITIGVEVVASIGKIYVYDGFDAGGKLVWQAETGDSLHARFAPPIDCKQGVFVYTDTGIACFTICYEAKPAEPPGD